LPIWAVKGFKDRRVPLALLFTKLEIAIEDEFADDVHGLVAAVQTVGVSGNDVNIAALGAENYLAFICGKFVARGDETAVFALKAGNRFFRGFCHF
jgi:hypothetical protein